MRASILLAAIVVGVLGTATARADGVGVVVTGDASIQPQLAAQMEDWLRQHGHVLVAAPLRPDALGTLIDCFVIEDLACARKVVEAEAGAPPRVMFAKAELVVNGSARDITITAYWFSRGSEPMAARRTCAACTDTKIHATIDEVMSTLAGKARADVGTLELAISPPGAVIRIDGKAASAGDALPIGDHTVEISAIGYASERHTVTIKGGDRVALRVSLAAETHRNKLPLVGIGVGVALFATGITLIVTSEEEPVRSRSFATRWPVASRCRPSGSPRSRRPRGGTCAADRKSRRPRWRSFPAALMSDGREHSDDVGGSHETRRCDRRARRRWLHEAQREVLRDASR